MDYLAKAREVLEMETRSLQKATDALGQEFADAIDLILGCLKARGKIVVTGIGKNLHIAEKISATLASTGATSMVLNPIQAMHGDLGIFEESDVLLVLSYSGESDEILSLLPIIHRLNVKIVSLTGFADSALAASSDVTIPVAIEKEACPFNMAPTSSTTATLAVGDALAMVLLEARGIREEDYAKFHPGGAIGRTLLLQVSDIMRSGTRLACVTQAETVRDAMLAMTRARSGSVSVVDSDNRLLGIFTDGDLRRRLAEQADLLDLSIQDVMTTDPITVRSDRLAVDVLSIFETHDIDDLIVVDEESRVIGSVDIQDLPGLKIL